MAAILAGGTIVLVGAGAAAATLPGPASRMMKMADLGNQVSKPTSKASKAAAPAPDRSLSGTTSDGSSAASMPALTPSSIPQPKATQTPAGSHSSAAPKLRTKPLVSSSITYDVRSGDTLSGIALWFKLHGYGALYAANAAKIGSNPNLIIPGERITISGGVMTVGSSQ